MNVVRLFQCSTLRNIRVCYRDYSLYRTNKNIYVCSNILSTDSLEKTKVKNKRQFSSSTIETIIKTQTGIFRSISESTPVSYAQDLFLSIHSLTGLPWWASIILTTVLVRSCVTLPLAIYQNYILAKVQNLTVEMNELVKDLKKETTIAMKRFNWTEQYARATYNRSLKKHWNNLIVRDNCHPFKASLLLWVQIPMWVVISVSLRNLIYMLPNRDLDALVTFNELCIGGIAWIPNLTIPDHSLILPITLGIVNLLIIEIQSKSKLQQASKMQKAMTNMFRALSLIMVPISASVPSCLCVYWLTSSTYGLIQNLTLMSPKVKRLVGIPKTPKELQEPYNHVLNEFKKSFTFKKSTIKS